MSYCIRSKGLYEEALSVLNHLLTSGREERNNSMCLPRVFFSSVIKLCDPEGKERADEP